jgi:signal transduction histidine kinase
VNTLVFDWRELRRWGLDERRLPKGSTVRYRPPSAWTLYRWPIVVGGSALVLQALLIAGLLMQRAQRQRIQRELDERLRFETFLAQLSRSFVDVPADAIDREIPHGLRRVGEFLGLDRVSLFELALRMGHARVMYAWARNGVGPVPTEMPAQEFSWMSARIARGEVVTFSRRDELPPEAETDRASFAAYGTCSHASIPLAEEGTTRRVLALSTVREERQWPEALVERLRLVAEVLVGILARKHAELEVVLAREQLRQFSGHLIAAQEEERRRIARELHDDLNQRLVLLALEISHPEHLDARSRSGAAAARRIAERVGEIANDVHRLAYRLHLFKLDYLGLTAAARGFCQEIAAAHRITVTFTEQDVPDGLPREVSLCVYRVLQEALSNVVRHSGSPRAEVALYGDGAGLRLTVRDFGLGMAPAAAATTNGLGLASMRERLRLVNGALTVDSSAASGTRLELQVPLSLLACVR